MTQNPPPRENNSVKKPYKRKLRELALKLHDLGFNIIPVEGKKPLVKWSPRERIDRDTLIEALKRATGVAVCGGLCTPFPDTLLVIIDIDNPDVLEECQWLKSIINSTVSWKTGPRCPKCSSKKVEPAGEYYLECTNCGAEFPLSEAKRGIGALIYVEKALAEKMLRGTSRGRDVEFLVNNYALIPPSIHPSGVQYEWIKEFNFNEYNAGIRPLVDTELENLLEEIGASKTQLAEETTRENTALEKTKTTNGLRTLQDSEILRIKELLLPAYKPGVRQYVWLFLSGWAVKAGISPISVARILKMLYDETGDKDPVKTRASAIVYSYKKAGIDIGQFAEEFEAIFGVKPYGLEREISEEMIKGRTGLQEILEQALGEEEALAVIKEIEEILQAGSPFRDSIIEILDYEKQLYAVANLRKLITCRARREGKRLVYKERVAIGAPTEVVYYVNPIGGVGKYQVKWETATRPRPLTIGPALLEDIVDRIKAEGLIVNSKLVYDIIAAIIEGFIRRGKAEIREEIEAPGFYLIEDKVIAIKVDISEPSIEELREALLLLNELAENWFKHVIDKFSTTIKWGVIAPFSFIYKQQGKWVKWLYLYGKSGTGKTTLGKIVLNMWGVDLVNFKTGSSIDSVARIGEVLSKSTFPVLVIEPAGALAKEDVVEVIKASIEGTVARGKFYRGSYIEIPALACIIFTSNMFLPRDDALLRRLKVLNFTYGEIIPVDKAKEFESRILPLIKSKLKPLGRFIANYMIKNKPRDPEQDAIRVLETAYKITGLEMPKWVYIEVKDIDIHEIYENMIEQIRNYLLDRINKEYVRAIGKVTSIEERGLDEFTQIDISRRVVNVLENQLIPWIIKKGDEVIITTGVISELQQVIGDIGGLKSIAELLGWEYSKRKIGGHSIWVITTTLDNFIKFLIPRVEHETEVNHEEKQEIEKQ